MEKRPSLPVTRYLTMVVFSPRIMKTVFSTRISPSS